MTAILVALWHNLKGGCMNRALEVWEVSGSLKDLFDRLGSSNKKVAHEWAEALQRFMRRENPWPTFMLTLGRYRSLAEVLKLSFSPRADLMLSSNKLVPTQKRRRVEVRILELPNGLSFPQILKAIKDEGLERPTWEDAVAFFQPHNRKTMEGRKLIFPHKPLSIPGENMHYVLCLDGMNLPGIVCEPSELFRTESYIQVVARCGVQED